MRIIKTKKAKTFVFIKKTFANLIKSGIISAFIWCACCAITHAQQVTFNGSIVTDSGKAVEDCYVKIVSKKGSRILTFFNTGKTNVFTKAVPFNGADSFFITATHIGYQPTVTSKYVVAAGVIVVNIIMPLLTNTLNNVLVKAPPVWVRGDTTFFTAEAFKEGDERKLKDLITKMPGFEIDEQGNLLYKKQVVEKMMIGGEEIFADKIKLLLNNFPVHVLNTIQAIEHQSNDPLLKGLNNENKVFVNLGLNNEKLKAAFGDGEAGAGTRGKYFFSPVLFSLYSKVKLGYIGNYNNTGNGIGWKEQDELKNDPVRLAEQWMMASDQLQLINNFESRRYINNGQIDNRFQLNIPFGKAIKTTTEFNLISDRQAQLVYNSSVLYNGNTFIQQSDTDNILNKPNLLTLKHTIAWSIDSTRELKGGISFYHNANSSIKNSVYNQHGIISSTQNNINNNFNSYAFALTFTHRISVKDAEKWSMSVSQHHYPQQVKGISTSWPTIFQLADSAYTVLHQQLNNTVTTGRAEWELIKKTKTGVLTTGVSATLLSAAIVSNLYLNNTKNTLTTQQPTGYSGNGNYSVVTLLGNTLKSVFFFKVPVAFKAEYGLTAAYKKEDTLKKHFVTPVYSLELNEQHKLGKLWNEVFNMSFSQKQAEPYQLYSILLPNMVNSFHDYLNVSLPIKMLNTYYGLNYNWPKKANSTSLLLMYTKNFTGFTPISSLNQFVQVTSDSLARNTSNNYHASITTNINSLAGKLHFFADISISARQGLIEQQGKLLQTDNFVYSFITGFKRSWGRTYFINLQAQYTTTGQRLPQALQAGVVKNSSDVKTSAIQRLAINKHSNIVLTTEWYNNNIFTPHQITFLFQDAEYNFTLPKTPLSFILRFQNLTNQLYYRSLNTGLLSQNFFTVPLVKRNVFMSIRYEL